jgi:hypothetical protein
LYWLKADCCPDSAARVKAGAVPEASPLAANAVDAMTTAAIVQLFKNLTVEIFIDLSSGSVENG